MPKRKDGLDTRQKILSAAAGLFAGNGYRKTTNQQIAKACGVNSALVSYHFGDKASLYAEAWRFAHEQALKKYPLDGGIPLGAPAVKKLRAVIAAEIHRRSDPELFSLDIMLNELSAPTGILSDVYQKSLFHLRDELRKIVREILGEDFPEEDRRLAVLSIFAQCTVPVKQIQQMEGMPQYRFEPESRIEFVYRFSLAGLLDMLNRKD